MFTTTMILLAIIPTGYILSRPVVRTLRNLGVNC